MDKKRVWCLYRVSTKSQVNKDEDIPMQRKACISYAKNFPEWEITRELYERGISGWKKGIDDRNELQIIKEGAVNQEFDILLIFMSDRLGRKKYESPFIIEFLKKYGVTVHSVTEGELKAEEHVDSLINYIRYWQAEGESLKTSIRVKERLKQLNEEGFWTGGGVPYGYDLVETNIKHPKKDKYLKTLKINEEEAKVVKLIFELSANKNYGRHKIASYLNERGYLNKGKKFTDKFIWRLLHNPIYIGKKRYHVKNYDSTDIEFKTQPYNENYRIIDDKLFYRSLEMIKQRAMKPKKENEKLKSGRPHSSQVLLSGLIKCGYCGAFMKTDYTYKTYKRKSDGKITKMITYRYRCKNGKNKTVPHEKIQVGAKTVDNEVAKIIKDFISNLNLDELIELKVNQKDETLKIKEQELVQIQRQIEKKENYLRILNNEVPKAILGESSFTPDILNKSIKQTEEEITELNNTLNKIKKEIEQIKISKEKIEETVETVIDWGKKFDEADIDEKKVLLSRIISHVEWTKDEIKPHINLIEF